LFLAWFGRSLKYGFVSCWKWFRDFDGGKFPLVSGVAPGANQLLKIGTRPIKEHYPLGDCKAPPGAFSLVGGLKPLALMGFYNSSKKLCKYIFSRSKNLTFECLA
jgi:hypothetical protein